MPSYHRDTVPLPPDASLLLVPHCILLVEPGKMQTELLAVENFLGYTAKDLSELGALTARVHPDDRADFSSLLAGQPLANGLLNLRLKNKDGEWERVQARLFSLLRDNENRVTQGALLVVPVLAMKLMLRSFMDNEARYRALVRQAIVGITMMDVDGRLVEWNDTLADITGYTADEVLGRPVWEIEGMMALPNTSGEEPSENLVRSVQEQGKAGWFGQRVSFGLLRKDGTERTVEAVYFPIQTPAGMMIGMVAQDITARVAAEEALHLQVLRSEAVARFARSINNGLDLESLLEVATSEVAQVLHVPFAIIHLYDALQDAMTVAYAFSIHPDGIHPEAFENIPMDLFRSLREQMGKVLFVPDVRAFPGMGRPETLSLLDLRSLVTVSLEHQGALVGTLTVVTVQKIRHFQADELTLLQTFADQLAQVIVHTRLNKSIQDSARMLRLVNEITRTTLQSASLSEMLPALAQQIVTLLQADGCYISLWDEEHQVPVPAAAYGLNDKRFLDIQARPGQPTLTMELLKNGAAICFMDYANSRYHDTPFAQIIEDRVLLALPLKVGDINLGSMLIGLDPFYPVPLMNQPYWAEISSQVSLAVYKAQLFEAERERRSDVEILQIATAEIAGSLDSKMIIQSIITYIQKWIPCDSIGISILSPDGSGLVSGGGSWDIEQTEVEKIMPMAIEQTIMSHFSDRPQPWIVEDIQTEPWLAYPGPRAFPHIHAWMAFPLIAYNQVQGYLVMGHRTSGFYTARHAERISPFVHQAAMTLQNARLFEQVTLGRERLQKLSRRLVRIQEEERRSLARELHDEISQSLTALNYALEMSKKLSDKEQLDALNDVQSLVGQIMGQVRSLSLNLRPGVLDDLGLRAALDWLFQRYQIQTGLRVQSDLKGLDRRFNRDVETAAFRLVQEALTNTARYAQVDQVMVQTAFQDGILQLMIEDQGCGFDLAVRNDPDHSVGINGMHERTSLLGGLFEICSAPGQGTRVTALFPIEHPVERRQYERKSSTG